MRFVSGLIGALLGLMAGAAQAAPFTNGSFEDGINGWSASNFNIVNDAANAVDGDDYFRFQRRANLLNGFSNGTLTQTFDLDPSVKQYKISFSVAANPSFLGNGLRVIVSNSVEGTTTNELLILVNNILTSGPDWSTVTLFLYANAGAGASSATLFF
jgi:hypothetical protein